MLPSKAPAFAGANIIGEHEEGVPRGSHGRAHGVDVIHGEHVARAAGEGNADVRQFGQASLQVVEVLWVLGISVIRHDSVRGLEIVGLREPCLQPTIQGRPRRQVLPWTAVAGPRRPELSQ